jgi:hypothetical protein
VAHHLGVAAAFIGAAAWGGAAAAVSAAAAAPPPPSTRGSGTGVQSLREFLAQSVRDAQVRSGLQPAPVRYWVVLGNQAADADSIITALTMAYLTKAKL